jgi:hypothetical protein
MMGHHTGVLMALAEREQAARELSAPQAVAPVFPPPAGESPRERQPADVVMCGWLSAWLVGYWLRNGVQP